MTSIPIILFCALVRICCFGRRRFDIIEENQFIYNLNQQRSFNLDQIESPINDYWSFDKDDKIKFDSEDDENGDDDEESQPDAKFDYFNCLFNKKLNYYFWNKLSRSNSKRLGIFNNQLNTLSSVDEEDETNLDIT